MIQLYLPFVEWRGGLQITYTKSRHRPAGAGDKLDSWASREAGAQGANTPERRAKRLLFKKKKIEKEAKRKERKKDLFPTNWA